MDFIKKYKAFEANKNENNKQEVRRSERLLSQAQREHRGHNVISQNRLLPSILFTDVVGSSELWNNTDIDVMMKQIKYHFKICDEVAKKYGGFIVKTIGDAFMIYFKPGENSLLNAIKAGEEIIKREKIFKLRVGICKGYMEEDSYVIQNAKLKDFYGKAVNLAARMESKISGTNDISFSLLDMTDNNIVGEINNIKETHEITKVDISSIDLKGVKANNCFKIMVN